MFIRHKINPPSFKIIQKLKYCFCCILAIFEKYFLKTLIEHFTRGVVVNDNKHEKATRVCYDSNY